jgi:hypothetical protein
LIKAIQSSLEALSSLDKTGTTLLGGSIRDLLVSWVSNGGKGFNQLHLIVWNLIAMTSHIVNSERIGFVLSLTNLDNQVTTA